MILFCWYSCSKLINENWALYSIRLYVVMSRTADFVAAAVLLDCMVWLSCRAISLHVCSVTALRLFGSICTPRYSYCALRRTSTWYGVHPFRWTMIGAGTFSAQRVYAKMNQRSLSTYNFSPMTPQYAETMSAFLCSSVCVLAMLCRLSANAVSLAT